MSIIFISGSRSITKLNAQVLRRIDKIMQQKDHIYVGDADGVDCMVQKYLHQERYPEVTVFCAGNTYRNNIGQWSVQYVDAGTAKGRAFFTVKDKKMAELADFALVVWDGQSQGSYANMREMLKYGKKTMVFMQHQECFVAVKDKNDLKNIKNGHHAQYQTLPEQGTQNALLL